MNLKLDKELQKEFDEAKNEKKLLDNKSLLAKSQFIDEIKNNLGEEIKKNGNKVEVIKPTFWEKIKKIIRKIFTGF